MSQRLLAELAHCGKAGAWKALKALIEAHLLETVKASESLDEGTLYRLTAKGFLTLQRAEVCSLVESYTRYLERSDSRGSTCASDVAVGEAGETLLSSRREVDSTRLQVDNAIALGIFGHSALGRCAYLVARALAHAPLTARQLSGATGLSRQTVGKVLKRLAVAGMVERGGRGEASRLSESFTAGAMSVAERKGAPEMAERRRERHAKERQARREYLAALDAAKAEGKTIEARPINDTLLLEEKATRKAKNRYAEVLEATRIKVEASHHWRTFAQTEAMNATYT